MQIFENGKDLSSNPGKFDWKNTLDDLEAASVSNFKHLHFHSLWHKIQIGALVEIINTDPGFQFKEPTFWIAKVIKCSGLYVKLKYESVLLSPNLEFWVNIGSHSIHHIGWCAKNGAYLSPPNSIKDQTDAWDKFLLKRLIGSPTIPSDFWDSLQNSLCMPSQLKIGLNVEILNKLALDTMIPGRIKTFTGGRIQVEYLYQPSGFKNEDDNYFYCHYLSPVLHPVGWSNSVGHALDSIVPDSYRKSANDKIHIKIAYDQNDSTFATFSHQNNESIEREMSFEEGMKLEAVNPIRLNEITVATVSKILKRGYMMISFDVNAVIPGRDWFCYHETSPYLLPAGYCDYHNLPLTPPSEYNKEEFHWPKYLSNKQAKLAPVKLFQKEIPFKTFREGQKIEAADLISPHLVCVATIFKISGRLLRIRFDGWSEAYDQWVECDSPDIYPIGWTEFTGHSLEVPPSSNGCNKEGHNFISEKNNRIFKKQRAGIKRRKSSAEQNITIQHDIFDNSETIVDNNQKIPASKSISHPAIMNALAPINRNVILQKNIPCFFNDRFDDVSLNCCYVLPPEVEKLPIEPLKWNTEDVVTFLKRNDCGAYSDFFNKKIMDGNYFLNMTKDSIMQMSGIKVSVALKIYNLIQLLTEKSNLK